MSTPDASVRLAIRSHGAQWLLLVLWGLLLGLSYPRPNLHVLAHVALAPLAILAIRGEPVRRVMLLAYIAAVVWWAVMVSWLAAVTVPGYLALAAYLGLYPLAFAAILRVLHGRFRPPLVLAVPLVWVALEYVRGLLLTGFPWFLLGQSQPTVMIQIADVVGAYGVSFVAAMTSGLIADLLTRPLVRLTPTMGRRWGSPVRLSLPLWLIAVTVTIGYGMHRLQETDRVYARTGPPLRVAVVQTNIPQSNKIHATDEEDLEHFGRLMELSEEAMSADPDLVIWPETMVPRPIDDESYHLFRRLGLDYTQYRDRILRFVQRHGVPVIVGAHAMLGWEPVEREGREAYLPTHRFNSAYLVEPPGRIAARYDKVHRVPFGEYIPWVRNWPWAKRMLLKLTPYSRDYTLRAGDTWTVFDLYVNESGSGGGTIHGQDARATTSGGGSADRWTLAAPICFEDVVSYVPREMVWGGPAGAAKRAELLVNLTNDGWFIGTAEALQHEQIARFRCVENRVPMARAVNTGVSSFIDSAGRVIGRVRDESGRTQQVAGYAVADLHRDDRRTFFARSGDVFAAIVLAVMLGLLVWALLGRLIGSRRP